MLKWTTLDAGSDRERLATEVNGLTIEVYKSTADPTVDPVWCYRVSVPGGRMLTEGTADTLDDAKGAALTYVLMHTPASKATIA